MKYEYRTYEFTWPLGWGQVVDCSELNVPWLEGWRQVDFHFQKDSIGSDAETAK